MAGLKLKPTKCHFLQKEVTFLGHVVSADGIKTDPEKVRAVKTWPIPVNLKELQSFLGLASYYRKFILGFSSIAGPLYTLCRKNIPFCGQQKQQAAFEELKHRLVSAPIIAFLILALRQGFSSSIQIQASTWESERFCLRSNRMGLSE